MESRVSLSPNCRENWLLFNSSSCLVSAEMVLQTAGSGTAPGWRAGPQGSGDLPSPVPFPAHINTFLLQTRLPSFSLYKEFINCPPRSPSSIGVGCMGRSALLKNRSFKAEICKNKVFAHLLLLLGSVCE